MENDNAYSLHQEAWKHKKRRKDCEERKYKLNVQSKVTSNVDQWNGYI